jgi:hypothetical protein
MQRILLAVAALVATTVTTPVHAAPATCTITDLDVAGTFPFSNIGGVGLAIPVDIEGGRFTMQRDAYTTAFPSPGLEFPTRFGPSGWLDWDPGPIDGTVDGNGLVTFQNFGMRFFTDFSSTGVPGLAGNINATFTTGIQARAVSGRSYLFSGESLKPDGTMRLVGTDFINFQIPLQTGCGMTCRLEPAPDLSALPMGPALSAVKGKVKAGPDAAVPDDELTLTAVLVPGATPAILDGSQDVLLRLKAAEGAPLNLLVKGGRMTARGKKRLTLADSDGSAIERISDPPVNNQQEVPAPPPTQGGSVVVKKAKKRTTVIFKVKGVDAAQFEGPVDATLGIGTQSAVRQVTFSAGKKGPRFK